MFTGIIEATCPIVAVRDHAGGRRLTVDLADLVSRAVPRPGETGHGPGGSSDPLVAGESVSIDGACLTVADIDGRDASRVAFDVIAETLRLTTLGRRRVGDRVNVERALRAGDRLGGHFVQGHVDGTAVLARREESTREVVLWFEAGSALIDEMIPKGSITVDGVSLTLVEVDRRAERVAGGFSVALIPTTLERTTLGLRREGDPVNIETDLLGKWIRRYLADMLGQAGRPAPALTRDKLREAGFV